MPECIHGLEIPLCDICYPKAVPEKPRVVRPATTRAPRVAGVTTTRKSISSAEQRVYHVTHIRNLESIVAQGLLADAAPLVDLSTDLTRELRRSAEVTPGDSVADYVPFYLSPTATLWEQLREGAADETRWSAAARAAASTDFVFLVSTVAALGPETVVTDGDAAGSLTRFAGGEAVTRMLEHLHDSEQSMEAEVLTKGSVPFDAVQLIGAANDRMREQVKRLSSIRVAVYPPWFQPTV